MLNKVGSWQTSGRESKSTNGGKMNIGEKDNGPLNQFPRRSLIQSAAAAAFILAGGPSARETGQAAIPLVNYGSDAGKTKLKPETIFPLFAAWLLVTTNGPFNVDADLMSCAARLHPDSAEKILTIFNDTNNAAAFKAVRLLFEQIAKDFAVGEAPYSGGQCPRVADTVTPVAGLLGTPTTVICKQSTKSGKASSSPK
jgi:hypothetical protein